MGRGLDGSGLELVSASRVESAGAEWALARQGGVRLAVAVPAASLRLLDDLEGETTSVPSGTLLVGPRSARNAAALRRHLAWLRPRPLGTKTSAGLGDRLGLATPGHVRAVRAVGGFAAIAPIFPQQSIREMTRTGRTPLEVMDDATWGMLAEGWRDGTGADADHLKTTADVDACLAVGFSMFTIDPSEHVDSSADAADLPTLRAKVSVLPWPDLSDTEESLRKRFLGQSFAVEHLKVAFDEAVLLRAAAKYGKAVAHVARMSRHLLKAAGATPVELEVSVDETETPTSPAEHYWVASELKRLGVAWVSLAPRFVGRFEKGVDYIGDLAELEKDVAAHAALARHFGPYKLSLHSGSDKFSVYPIAARLAKGLVHLKTAGTSYLEALRTAAAEDPAFFREVYAFARERYDTDKASYHVSAELAKAPAAADVPEGDLPSLLEHFHAREILHVTFGSVLKEVGPDGGLRFKDRLFGLLRSNPEAYAA
ncbi:MAG TPA: tagaturonate epimerase family protein, partial [Vicinamibacteria bacterium]